MADVLRQIASVRIVSTPDGADVARGMGLNACGILESHAEEVWAIPNTRTAVRGRPWMLMRQLKENLRLLPQLRSDLQAAWAVDKPDLAIIDFTLPMAGHWARQSGIRWWTSHPSPLAIETMEGTPSYLGGWQPPQSAFGRIRDAIGRSGTRTFKRFACMAFNKELNALGFSGPYRKNGTESVYSDEIILALGMRELEFPRDWPNALRFVGPVLFRPANPEDCSTPWLDGRRRNILVTVGTHLLHARREIAGHFRRWAAEQPEFYWHYSAGGIDEHREDVGENWKMYRYINYNLHLPLFDAIIHHAGAGITYHALNSGLPTVVWPQDYDQFDFAARLANKGLAVRCENPAQVPEALHNALADRGQIQRAHVFAQKLRAYDIGSRLRGILVDQGMIPLRN